MAYITYFFIWSTRDLLYLYIVLLLSPAFCAKKLPFVSSVFHKFV